MDVEKLALPVNKMVEIAIIQHRRKYLCLPQMIIMHPEAATRLFTSCKPMEVILNNRGEARFHDVIVQVSQEQIDPILINCHNETELI